MTTFVLVPGAWLGGYAWERVCTGLLDAGHDVLPVTLPGLGNRADQPVTGLRHHVDDLIGVVERTDLYDVVLVGHSYGGLPTCQAAVELGDRLRHLVLVDANVPVEGQSFADLGRPEDRERLLALLAEHDGAWPPPAHDSLEGHGLAHADVHFFEDWSKPHPGRTLTDAVPAGTGLRAALREVSTTYVKCTALQADPSPEVAALLDSEHWRLVTLDTGHWPMWSASEALTAVLLESVS